MKTIVTTALLASSLAMAAHGHESLIARIASDSTFQNALSFTRIGSSAQWATLYGDWSVVPGRVFIDEDHLCRRFRVVVKPKHGRSASYRGVACKHDRWVVVPG